MKRCALVLALTACRGEAEVVAPRNDPPRVIVVGCQMAPMIPKIPTESHVDGERYTEDDLSMYGGLYGTSVGTLGTRSVQPAVAIGPASAIGRIGGTQPMRFYLRQHVGGIRDCYGALLKVDPALHGTATLSFGIDAAGNATGITATGDQPLAACLRNEFDQIVVPKPPAPIGRIEFPFHFEHDPDAATSIVVPDETSSPWTPYAELDRELDEPHGIAAGRAAEAAIRARAQELDACFPNAHGSLRAMLTIVENGAVTSARVGGFGDFVVEHCVAEALADLHLAIPPGGFAEVACDLARGDARPWRLSPDPYAKIEVSQRNVKFEDESIVPHADDPDPLPGQRAYLVVLAPDATAGNLDLALTWASEGNVTLVATPGEGGFLTLLGAGRNASSIDENENESNKPHPSLEVREGRVSACVQHYEAQARVADANELATMLREFAAVCRRRDCAPTLGIAHDPELTTSGDLATVAQAAKRVGFDRVLLGAFSTCRSR